MKVKELIKYLDTLPDKDKERMCVLHHWNGKQSYFLDLLPAATKYANTKNLLVFTDNNFGKIEPKMMRKDV